MIVYSAIHHEITYHGKQRNAQVYVEAEEEDIDDDEAEVAGRGWRGLLAQNAGPGRQSI